MIGPTGTLLKPLRKRRRKHLSECRELKMFPSNQECRCPLEELKKLSMRANELQCNGAENLSTACPYTRFLGRVYSRKRKQVKISPNHHKTEQSFGADAT